ncbi:MAG: hypothetical protein ABIO35_05970 [Nitrobacter sp.]
MIRRYGQTLVDEGFFADLAELERYAADLSALEADPKRHDIAWHLGLDADIVSDAMQCRTQALEDPAFYHRRAAVPFAMRKCS